MYSTWKARPATRSSAEILTPLTGEGLRQATHPSRFSQRSEPGDKTHLTAPPPRTALPRVTEPGLPAFLLLFHHALVVWGALRTR